MCRRKTKDPLLSFIAARGYTMLSNMRTGVEPGDVWIEINKRFDPLGHVSSLFADEFKLPNPIDETLVGLNDRRSKAIEASVALDIAGPVLVAMGAPAVLGELKASVARVEEARLSVSLTDVVERSIPLADIAQNLPTKRIKPKIAKTLVSGRRIAIADAILLSGGFLIEASTRRGERLDLGIGNEAVASVRTGVRVKKLSNSQVQFAGESRLAIGARLYELVFEGSSIRVAGFIGKKVLGDEEGAELPEPFYFDGSEGELFAEFRLATV